VPNPLCSSGIPSSALQLRNVTGVGQGEASRVHGRAVCAGRDRQKDRWPRPRYDDLYVFMYPMRPPACPFRQSTSRRHHGTRIGDICTVCRQAHNVSSIRLSTLQPLGISKNLKTPGLCKQSCTDFRARVAKTEQTPCAHDHSISLLLSLRNSESQSSGFSGS
jgi:hypothetical protein